MGYVTRTYCEFSIDKAVLRLLSERISYFSVYISPDGGIGRRASFRC
jgi:hypothetical protein